MTKPNPKSDYSSLKQELDIVMEKMSRDDLNIDEALVEYERGLSLIKQIEDYLKNAENKITELKKSLSTENK